MFTIFRSLRLPTISEWTLFTALMLSTVAAYYAIAGLVAIFAAAVIPIIIMGTVLEIAKVTTTVWLRTYWHRTTWLARVYLVPAVLALALLTSMGVFGYLSKAHMDQAVPTGDVAQQVALLDEKIKVQRDNIANAREVIKQMDAAVNGVIATGDQEVKRADGTTQIRSAAERSLQIRRSQARDRAELSKQIEQAQAQIVQLQEQRAPIASELRKVEAEVGPVKYIAALIYGDNPDANLLERAVRWVIILIVLVFDPLALVLVVAANQSLRWDREQKSKPTPPLPTPPEPQPDLTEINQQLAEAARDAQAEQITEPVLPVEPQPQPQVKSMTPVDSDIEDGDSSEPPIIRNTKPVAELSDDDVHERPGDYINQWTAAEYYAKNYPAAEPTPQSQEVVTQEVPDPRAEYVTIEGKGTSQQAARGLYPELMLKADQARAANTGFGTEWPKYAVKGDLFVRVDYLPNRVFKFNGAKWIEVSKDNTASYSHNQQYIRYLINKIRSGEYDPELLTDAEREQIELMLTDNSQKG